MRNVTTKKIRVKGTETYINQETGEIIEMEVINVEERDFNFHKFWIETFLATLDIVGDKKTKLVFWIINNLNRDNQLIYTQREISEKANVSLQTVSRTLKTLEDSNFLIRQKNGVYRINPDIVFKGTKNHRGDILLKYYKKE